MNQPLAAVVANGNAALRWLNRATPDIEEAEAAIQRIMSEGARASQIIARTRQIAMKGGEIREAFHVNAMIPDAVEITSPRSGCSRPSSRLILPRTPAPWSGTAPSSSRW